MVAVTISETFFKKKLDGLNISRELPSVSPRLTIL